MIPYSCNIFIGPERNCPIAVFPVSFKISHFFNFMKFKIALWIDTLDNWSELMTSSTWPRNLSWRLFQSLNYTYSTWSIWWHHLLSSFLKKERFKAKLHIKVTVRVARENLTLSPSYEALCKKSCMWKLLKRLK